ncbi:MAG: hypothetical protein EOP37_22335 [Rubrivivax sp.]|nr:MAG: hypothetical protein EOP37_22335 [Rubrivivax sp.]
MKRGSLRENARLDRTPVAQAFQPAATAQASPATDALQKGPRQMAQRHLMTRLGLLNGQVHQGAAFQRMADAYTAVRSGLHEPGLVLQRVVNTMGGAWNTNRYRAIDDVKKYGAAIELEFQANDNVDATKIGLTQTSRRYGSAERANPTAQALDRMVQVHRTDFLGADVFGTKIDRRETANNPIYGGDRLAGGQDLSHTREKLQKPVEADRPSGLHYRLGAKTSLQNTSAILHDTPTKSKPLTGDGGHVFETTALALEGVQQGTYFGSVQWGWTLAAGNISLLPLRVVSNGAPSRAFLEAAERWKNAAGGNKPLPTDDIIPCYFEVEFASTLGEELHIVGNRPELANWDPANAVKLEYAGPNKWQTYVGLNAQNANQNLQYKYVVKEGDVLKRWEGGSNHERDRLPQTGQNPAGKFINLNDKFNYS